ncbi:MAG: hypothetical protein WC309_01290 [Candidatus Paceibacterota bacterium]|jgi:hypothetical protein
MLSIDQVKTILNNQKISDREAEEIRDSFLILAEIIFSKWKEQKTIKKAIDTINLNKNDYDNNKPKNS